MQPLYASGTADASGDVTLTFQAPGMGRAVAGTIAVPSSPGSVIWTAHLGGHAVGSWSGPSSWGPVVAAGSEELQVKGSGLTAGAVMTGAWSVTQGTPNDFVSVVPGATATHGSAVITGPVSATISGTVPIQGVSGGTPVPVSQSPATGLVPINASGSSPITLWSPSSSTSVRSLSLAVGAATAGTVVVKVNGNDEWWLQAPTTPGRPALLPLDGFEVSSLTLVAGTASSTLTALGAVVLA